MREIAVVTGTRADYGIYYPVLKAINNMPGLCLRMMVCGAHLSQKHGNTVDIIESDGFEVVDRLETLEENDSPECIAASMGHVLEKFGQAFASRLPDILLVLGDRYEMFAATAAAMPFNIPTAHIHGGEATEGLIDEAIRHSITKMSHLHFTATQTYAQRVIQLGEIPDRVFVTGAPSLDNLNDIELLSREEMEAELQLSLESPPLLVTFHPVTLEYNKTNWHIKQLLHALNEFSRPTVITYPNTDTHASLIIDAIDEFAQTRPNVRTVNNLGTQKYFSLMALSGAMIGNSSSGIIEAASFGLPVINIGNRQKGRVRSLNVINVAHDHQDISGAITKSLSHQFRLSLKGMENPYGHGKSAERIVKILAEVELGSKLIKKSFHDIQFFT